MQQFILNGCRGVIFQMCSIRLLLWIQGRGCCRRKEKCCRRTLETTISTYFVATCKSPKHVGNALLPLFYFDILHSAVALFQPPNNTNHLVTSYQDVSCVFETFVQKGYQIAQQFTIHVPKKICNQKIQQAFLKTIYQIETFTNNLQNCCRFSSLAGYSLERLRRFWTSPGKQGRDEKLHQVPKNSEDSLARKDDFIELVMKYYKQRMDD